LFLIISGQVTVSRLLHDGHVLVLDIYQQDEFFGESGLLDMPGAAERAVARQKLNLMMWTAAEIEELSLNRPRLGVALIQMLAQRTLDLGQRIESFSLDNIPRRMARSLLRFAERFGTEESDGSVRMMALTHELLAHYVGTSREIVTHYMNQFRRDGYLTYSRKHVTLDRGALSKWLHQTGRKAGRVNGLGGSALARLWDEVAIDSISATPR
jgi:CRP-like cAMP-binding protein